MEDTSDYSRTVFTTVATETITVTVTSGSELKRRAELAARQTTSTPTSVPTYLSGPCTESGIYGSACACLGIRRTTSTAPTPTVTSSVTTTTTTTTTISPPTCTGATCGSFVIVNCGLGQFGDCACGTDIDGNSYCFISQSCGASPSCTSNADCGQGSRCLVGSCCGGSVCQAEAPTDQCINPAANILSLSDGGFNSTVCSSLSCPDDASHKRAIDE